MGTRREEIHEPFERFTVLEETLPSESVGNTAKITGTGKFSDNGSRPDYRIFMVVGLAAIYFVAAKLGLKLAYVYPSASTVWPGTGIALTAMLLLGYRVWPGIFLGAFLANVTTAGSVATSFGIALGNTLEGLIGACLLDRFANGRNVFDRAQDILKFVFLAATLTPS